MLRFPGGSFFSPFSCREPPLRADVARPRLTQSIARSATSDAEIVSASVDLCPPFAGLAILISTGEK